MDLISVAVVIIGVLLIVAYAYWAMGKLGGGDAKKSMLELFIGGLILIALLVALYLISGSLERAAL